MIKSIFLALALAVYFAPQQQACASRNVACIAQITAKVLSASERSEEVVITYSPLETEMASFIDLEIEVASVDSAPACEYRVGQKIKLTIVRDDINDYNRVKKDAVIKPGTVLKGSIDHIGEIGYSFEKISEVLN